MEEWKPIPGYPDYEISSLGRVRTFHYLSVVPDNQGYGLVCLSKPTQSNKKIHRLMAEAFLPNPDNKPQVDHINRIVSDNRLENLRWATASENNFNRAPPRGKDMLYIYPSGYGKWRLRIKHLKIDRMFDSLEEAQKARTDIL